MTRKINYKLVLGIIGILLLQILVYIHWGFQKEGLHTDEVLSFGLANSSSYPLLSGITDGWMSSNEFFTNYLTVVDGETFDFGNVYLNQTSDVHPPFFYFLLHIVSSLFPNQFSIWFGIGINLFFVVGVNLLVFLISKMISKTNGIALSTMIFYGFSIAAVSMVIFVRMYTILTFFCMLLVYFVLRLCNNFGTLSNKIAYYGILTTTFFGFFTHYYYLIFAFGVSVAYIIYMFVKNRKNHFFKSIFEYIFALAFGFIINIAVYPTSIDHILNSNRGVASIDAFISFYDKLSNLVVGFGIVSTTMFIHYYFFIPFLIIAIFLYINKKIKAKDLKNSFVRNSQFYGIFLATVIYFVLISIIAPYIIVRYQLVIYPAIAILFVISLNFVISTFIKKEKSKNLLLIAMSALIAINGFIFSNVVYLYEGEGEITSYLEQLENTNAITIGLRWQLAECLLDFEHYDNLAIIEYSSESFEDIFYSSDFTNDLIIYYANDLDSTEYEEYIFSYYNSSSQIYENDYFYVIQYTT